MPSHYAGIAPAGHFFTSLDNLHFSFQGLAPHSAANWANHVVRAYSRAATVSDLDASILHFIATRTEAGDTSFGSLKIGTTDWTIFKKISFVRALVVFLGLTHSSPKILGADQLVAAMGIQSISEVGPSNSTGAASIAAMVASEVLPAVDKVHAFLAHGLAIFMKSGGVSGDGDSGADEKYGMVRRVAELIGWPELMNSRSVAGRQRKEKNAVMIASLKLGLCFPGSLVCLYAPEAHIHHTSAAPLILAANADGPALTLTEEANLRYASALFARPSSFVLDGRLPDWIKQGMMFPAGTADLFGANESIDRLAQDGTAIIFLTAAHCNGKKSEA